MGYRTNKYWKEVTWLHLFYPLMLEPLELQLYSWKKMVRFYKNIIRNFPSIIQSQDGLSMMVKRFGMQP